MCVIKLKFRSYFLLAGGGSSLFAPQMCLETVNQLKCTKLANWLVIFPKMYTECAVNEHALESSVKYTHSSYWNDSK